jgi:hypothetical protein
MRNTGSRIVVLSISFLLSACFQSEKFGDATPSERNNILAVEDTPIELPDEPATAIGSTTTDGTVTSSGATTTGGTVTSSGANTSGGTPTSSEATTTSDIGTSPVTSSSSQASTANVSVSTTPATSTNEILCEADRSGQTNASPAIQECVSRLPASGGIISLLPGSYLMQTRLNVTRSNVKFRTKGLETSNLPCNSVACAAFKASPTFSDGLAFFYAGPEVSGTSLDHIVFDGNRSQRALSQIPSGSGRNALIYDANNSSIIHSIFMNAAMGTALGIAMMPTPSSNVYFAANKFLNNGDNQSGYWADGLTVGHVAKSTFIGNIFIDNTDVAMIFGGATDTKISHNYFQQTNQRIFAAIMTTNWSVGATDKKWADFRGMHLHSNSIFCGTFCDVGIQLGVLNFGGGDTAAGRLQTMGGGVYNNIISGNRQLINVSGGGSPDFPIRIFGNTFDRPNGVILPHRISNNVNATDYNIEKPWDWSFVDTLGDATPISSYTWGKLF